MGTTQPWPILGPSSLQTAELPSAILRSTCLSSSIGVIQGLGYTKAIALPPSYIPSPIINISEIQFLLSILTRPGPILAASTNPLIPFQPSLGHSIPRVSCLYFLSCTFHTSPFRAPLTTALPARGGCFFPEAFPDHFPRLESKAPPQRIRPQPTRALHPGSLLVTLTVGGRPPVCSPGRSHDPQSFASCPVSFPHTAPLACWSPLLGLCMNMNYGSVLSFMQCHLGKGHCDQTEECSLGVT